MVKIKTEEYLQLHRLIDQIAREKTLIPIILNEKLDDAKSMIAPDVIVKIEAFAKALFKGIYEHVENITWQIVAGYENTNGSVKRFRFEVVDHQPTFYSKFLFDGFKKMGEDCSVDELKEYVYKKYIDAIIKGVNTQRKCEESRVMWNSHRWSDYYFNADLEEEEG